MDILAATGNAGKIVEFRRILEPLGIGLVTPRDVGGIPDVEENGATFEENAALKARAAAEFADMRAIADDSGLEVESLNGSPGIYSARYARNDQARIKRLLTELGNRENRRARFVCVIALTLPEGLIQTFRGEVSGSIASVPSGEAGFGYDPVFIPKGCSETFAQMGLKRKNTMSHRAEALKKMALYLAQEQQK